MKAFNMESACLGTPLYRGTSRTDAQKLDCHRKVFRIRIRQHLTQGLGIHRAPLPCPNTLGKRDSGAPNKRNLGFGSANFSKCMWIGHMCHNDFFLRRKGFPGTLGTLLVSWQPPLWRIQGPPRKVFYGNPTFVCPRKKTLYTMVQRATWTPY